MHESIMPDMQRRLAIAKNAASNGRMVNVLSFLLMVALAVTGHGTGYFYAALFPIFSIAFAYLADIDVGIPRRPAAIAMVICAVVPFIFILIAGV